MDFHPDKYIILLPSITSFIEIPATIKPQLVVGNFAMAWAGFDFMASFIDHDAGKSLVFWRPAPIG